MSLWGSKPRRFGRAASVGFSALMMASPVPLLAQQSDQTDNDQTENDQSLTAELDALIDASQSSEAAITAARQQIAAKDLSGAASTLERALLVNRNADDARALYASILCRLDDPKGAAYEINLLNNRNVSGALLTELRQHCGLTPSAPEQSSGSADVKKTQVSGSLSVGLAYDTDSIGASNFQFVTAGPAFTADALSTVIHLDATGRNFLNGGKSWIYGGFNLDAKFELDGTPITTGPNDYQIGDLFLGYGTKLGGTELQLGGVVKHSRVFDQAFATEYGGQVKLSFAQKDQGAIILDGEIVYQDYTIFGGSPFRDGWKFDLALAKFKPLDNDGYVYFGAGLEFQTANVRGFFGGRVFGAAKIPLAESGAYAQVNGTYRYINFTSDNSVIFTFPRVDHRIYGRGALGLPISGDRLFAEAGVSYTVRDSSAASMLADFDSLGVDLKLILKLGS